MSRGRNRWKRGSWLVQDDESGHVVHSDQVVKRWDGLYVRKTQDEPPHPQWFVRGSPEPRPLPFYRPPDADQEACNAIPPYIGDTTVPALRSGPAAHLFLPGIGEMEIGCTFFVE